LWEKRDYGQIERIAMDQINHTLDQMLESDAKYRFVIDAGTLK
jgi:D-arabinose 1-dehydrogenase-like Zn-dependent alcohol dehydrogenase